LSATNDLEIVLNFLKNISEEKYKKYQDKRQELFEEIRKDRSKK